MQKNQRRNVGEFFEKTYQFSDYLTIFNINF